MKLPEAPEVRVRSQVTAHLTDPRAYVSGLQGGKTTAALSRGTVPPPKGQLRLLLAAFEPKLKAACRALQSRAQNASRAGHASRGQDLAVQSRGEPSGFLH